MADRNLAFYGDSIGEEVYAIDIDRMQLAARIPTGLGPYPVDKVADDTLFAITRNEASITPIDLNSLTNKPKIGLGHRPRSSAPNPKNNGLVLVSGADRPMTSVVDLSSGRVRLTVGSYAPGPVDGFGGSLASGHERWVDADRFFVLDRVNRSIQVYSAGTGSLVWGTRTPSPVHHLQADNAVVSRWFAVCEGIPHAIIPPAIMVVVERGGAFSISDMLFLPIPAGDIARSGGHHVDAPTDDQRHLYVGSSEGNTYVLEKDPLRVVSVLPTGLGNGHTGFTQVDGRRLAITINHTDRHVTVIDADRHQTIAHIEVTKAEPKNASERTQGHTSIVRGNRFYMMASLDARFCEIDLEQMKVSKTLDLPHDAPPLSHKPVPMQGTFVPSAPAAGGGARLLTQCC